MEDKELNYSRSDWVREIDSMLGGKQSKKVKSEVLFFNDFVGQKKIIQDLKVHIAYANNEGVYLDHIALFGPPGLGKTTLARAIANEMGQCFEETTGHSITTKKVEEILFSLSEGDVLFIDELHAMRAKISEMLYSPMQDFTYEGMHLPRFTMIGATTNLGMLPKPMRDRICHTYYFQYYSLDEITEILVRLGVDKKVASFIAERCKGVPRHATQFLKKIKGYANLHDDKRIKIPHCKEAFEALEVDAMGLDSLDRRILMYLHENRAISRQNAIGVDTLVASVDVTKDIFTAIIEPALLNVGFIKRTSRGRMLSKEGLGYVKVLLKERI